MQSKIKSIIARSLEVKSAILADDALVQSIEQSTQLIIDCFQKGNRLYFCGNGGSAADAQHLAAEFTGRFYKDREPLPAEALHVNTSFLTAVANDYSYDQIYERMIKAQGRAGDVLVGISTSGNSKNVVLAQIEGQKRGMTTIAMTGSGGGEMRNSANILLNMPSTDTPRIQEGHILVGHIICELVEEGIFGS